VLTAAAITLRLDVRTVGDMGELPDTLPMFLLPDIPLTLETLQIILPYSRRRGGRPVGKPDDASIVDDLTDTTATRTRNASARAWPTPPPASSAAWPAAR
jgi:SulP family sulfate permease